MATPLNVLSALTASQGLSGSSAAFASLTVNGVEVTGGGGISGAEVTASFPLRAEVTGAISGALSDAATVNSGLYAALAGATFSGAVTASSGISASFLRLPDGTQLSSSSQLAGASGISGAEVSASLTASVALLVSNNTYTGTNTFNNDVTINGTLYVSGTTTTVNSTDLLISDKKIVIASGSNTAALATTAGLYVGNDTSAVSSWSFVSASFLGLPFHYWNSTDNINLASGKGLLFNGAGVLNKNTSFGSDVNIYTNSGYGVLGIGNITSTLAGILGVPTGTGAVLSGSATTALVAPAIVLSGSTLTTVSNALTVQGATTLAGVSATTVTASVGVSGTLGNFATLNMQGLEVATRTGVQTVYNTYRHTVSGTLNGSGAAEVNLTSVSATGFDYLDLHKIAVDVMIDDGTGLAYTNDLASVKLENSASQVYVKIDAPATPNRGYRLVAVNEGDLTF